MFIAAFFVHISQRLKITQMPNILHSEQETSYKQITLYESIYAMFRISKPRDR